MAAVALAFTSPDGPEGARVDVVTPTGRQTAVMTRIPSGPDPVYGSQLQWAIDALVGNDNNAGTPAAPLRTQAEFNSRFAALLVTAGAATLQLVGDVIDAPLWLRSTSFAAGSSLTVSATTATIGTATITLVTGLNPSSATLQPWQLTTTGIDWTTVPLGSRLLLSNGSLGFIRSVIDANNVVVGALVTLASASVVPTAALTITVQSLSRALAPNVNVLALDTTAIVTVRDASFDTGNVTSVAAHQANVLIFGCEVKAANGTTIAALGGLQLRGCRITMPAGSPTLGFRSGGGAINMTSCVFSGATTGFVTPNTPGATQFQHTCIQNAQFLVQNSAHVTLSTSFHSQHTTTAVRCEVGGIINSGVCQITGTAGAGLGCDVRAGQLWWNGAAAKPTISGAAGDCAVAGVTYTYAALGSGKTASIIPVTAPPTPVVNTDPNRGPGIATMAQIG